MGLKHYGFFDKIDDIRDPIPGSAIDWSYLVSEDETPDRIHVFVVYSPKSKFGIGSSEEKIKLVELMLNNQDKIYDKPNKSSIKTRLIFNEAYVLNTSYTIDKYNGKQSTFYVDKSLLPELLKLKLK